MSKIKEHQIVFTVASYEDGEVAESFQMSGTLSSVMRDFPSFYKGRPLHLYAARTNEGIAIATYEGPGETPEVELPESILSRKDMSDWCVEARITFREPGLKIYRVIIETGLGALLWQSPKSFDNQGDADLYALAVEEAVNEAEEAQKKS